MDPKIYLSTEKEIRNKNSIIANAAVRFPVKHDDIRDSI